MAELPPAFGVAELSVPSRSSRRAPCTVWVSWQFRHAARQTGRLAGKLALRRGGHGEDLVGHLRVGMRRQRPGLAGLVVARQADDVGRFGKGAAGGRLLLKAIDAQELGRALGGVGFAQVRVVAGGTLHLPRFERQPRLDAGRTGAHRGSVGGAQFAVASGQRGVVGEGDRVVVGQVHAEVARETGGRSGAGRHRAARPGAAQRNRLVGLAAQHIDTAQCHRAVVAGQAQLGAAARPGREFRDIGIDRARGVRRVGCTRELAVPQRRGRNVFGRVRRVAEHADLRFAGRLHGARTGDRQVVLGVGDVGDLGRADRPHRDQRGQRSQQAHDQQRGKARHQWPPRNWNTATRPLNMSATKTRLRPSTQTPAGR